MVVRFFSDIYIAKITAVATHPIEQSHDRGGRGILGLNFDTLLQFGVE